MESMIWNYIYWISINGGDFMEDNITELKKICESLEILKNNLFHIFL